MHTIGRVTCLTAIAALGLAAVASAQASDSTSNQVSGMSALGIAAMPQSRLLINNVPESIRGTWIGGAVRLYVDPIVIEGTVLTGDLNPADGTVAFPRTAGELRGFFRIETSRYFGIEGGYTLRAFDSPAGYQRWNIPMVGGRFATPLGTPELEAFVRGAYMPGVKVSGQATPKIAVQGEAGISVSPRKYPFVLLVNYRLERYDLPTAASGTTRVEQFEQFQVGLGLALGRYSKP